MFFLQSRRINIILNSITLFVIAFPLEFIVNAFNLHIMEFLECWAKGIIWIFIFRHPSPIG